MRQTSKPYGGWAKPKNWGTYSHSPIYIVEPKPGSDERGIVLRIHEEWHAGATLSTITGTQVMGWSNDDRGGSNDNSPDVKLAHEINALARSRRVAEAAEVAPEQVAAQQAENQERAIEAVTSKFERGLAEARHRLDQVRGTADPNRLGSQKRRSYETALRILSDYGVDSSTGEISSWGKLGKWAAKLARWTPDAPALPDNVNAPAQGDRPKTGPERMAELKRMQDNKPTPRLTPHQRAMGQFNTPHPIAYRMAELAGVKGKTVLDPTAGEGRLLQYAREQGADKAHGFEIDSSLTDYASQHGVLHADFMSVPAAKNQADVVLLNPPFTTRGGPDTAGIMRKALHDCWTGEGRAVVLLPAGPSGEKLIAPYRDMVVDEHDLADDAFRREGTSVRSRLYVLEKESTAKSERLILEGEPMEKWDGYLLHKGQRRPPGAGWQPAPHSKKGYWRKRGPGNRWVYWNPAHGVHQEGGDLFNRGGTEEVGRLKPEDSQREAEHHEAMTEVIQARELAKRTKARFGNGSHSERVAAALSRGDHEAVTRTHSAEAAHATTTAELDKIKGQIARSRDIHRIHELQDKARRIAAAGTALMHHYETRQASLFDEDTSIPEVKRLSRAELHDHSESLMEIERAAQRHHRKGNEDQATAEIRRLADAKDKLKAELPKGEFQKVLDRFQETVAREQRERWKRQREAGKGKRKKAPPVADMSQSSLALGGKGDKGGQREAKLEHGGKKPKQARATQGSLFTDGDLGGTGRLPGF